MIAFKKYMKGDNLTLTLKDLEVTPFKFCDVILQKLNFYMGGYTKTHDKATVREMLRQTRREAVKTSSSSSSDSQ